MHQPNARIEIFRLTEIADHLEPLSGPLVGNQFRQLDVVVLQAAATQGADDFFGELFGVWQEALSYRYSACSQISSKC